MKKQGFDNEKYITLQTGAIKKRLSLFSGGSMYLEVGGKFLHDGHASRVLPGFKPDNKVTILSNVIDEAQILLCLNSQSIVENKPINRTSGTYQEETLKLISIITEKFGKKPLPIFNFYPNDPPQDLLAFESSLSVKTYHRYIIKGYPQNLDLILSDDGFGKDDQIPSDHPLNIVVAPSPGAGKFSTCLGQIYKELKESKTVGYAKYETFPIWNLPVGHPVNLAYEAATADLGDYNLNDTYHEKAYNTHAVNYNRDVDAFELLNAITQRIAPSDSPLYTYKSPTDMGINHAGFAINNDQAIQESAIVEIRKRIEWYSTLEARGEGEKEWVRICEDLLNTALTYSQQTH